MDNLTSRVCMAFLLCCIVIAAMLWLTGPRVANHFGWLWQGTLPDHVDYAGRTYAPGYSGRCLTVDEAKQTLINAGDKLIQAGSVPAMLGVSAPLFVESSDGNTPAFSLIMQVYVEKNSGCYVSYGIEGGP